MTSLGSSASRRVSTIGTSGAGRPEKRAALRARSRTRTKSRKQSRAHVTAVARSTAGRAMQRTAERLTGIYGGTMSATGLDVFDKTLQTTNSWLDEISEALGPDRNSLGRCFRSYCTSCGIACRSSFRHIWVPSCRFWCAACTRPIRAGEAAERLGLGPLCGRGRGGTVRGTAR